MTTPSAARPWWQTAVFYQIYVRSFADSDGDGVGDLPGIRSRLPYLRDLGVDALWLTPFYRSPMVDHGYDVADPRDVDPLFGTLADFDALARDAHDLGLRLTVDIVPNHSSSEHPWFRAALAAAPGGPERDRYLFRDGRGPGGQQPPNNWRSVFGGPAWERVADGQWYLHLFAPEQPDLNWDSPEVTEDYQRTLRFWLDRGVDGFRIDVAHGLVKDAQLRENAPGDRMPLLGRQQQDAHAWNQPGVHEVFRSWRKVLDSYPGDRVAVGEIWVREAEDLARYVRPDELHLAFNFQLLKAPWDAAALRAGVDESLRALAAVGAPTTWVLSNHDVVRHLTRYGGGTVGRRRAAAALLLVAALPGPLYLYQGEELGLPEVDVPDAARQDPVWLRSGHTERGRDGCRVPIPWSGVAPPYGFCPVGVQPWLPMPADWAPVTVAAETDRADSMLGLYRRALSLRRSSGLAAGRDPVDWLPGAASTLQFQRGGVVVLLNLGPEPVPLPTGELLVSSGPLEADRVPTDTAVWVRSD